MKNLVVATLLILIPLALGMRVEKARFDNYRVYKLKVDTLDQLQVLKELQQSSDSYDFWDAPAKVESEVNIVVPPHKFAQITEVIDRFNFDSEVTINNLQEVFDKELPKKQRKTADVDGEEPEEMNWTEYHSYETIYAWIHSLELEFPGIVTVEDIGMTTENRPIKLVKISKKSGNPAIFIESNIHAREWIASATATFLINALLRAEEPEFVDLAENIDWYIVPLLNVDGHVYTRTTNRNWRKTRSDASLLCQGVDANRNFEFAWMQLDENGGAGSSKVPCSDTYAGAAPFSEPEARAIDNYLKAHPNRFDVYISFHSYGHYFLFPYGASFVPAANVDELVAIGNAARDQLKTFDGIEYTVGSTIEALYTASGSSVDHAYAKYGIKIAYTIEQRGNGPYGNFGFFLPKEFIIPNAIEVVSSFEAFVAKAREFGYLVRK